jgi:hypothetical protein
MIFAMVAEIAIERAEELAAYQRSSVQRRKEAGGPRKGMPDPGFGFRVPAAQEDQSDFLGYEIDEEAAAAIRWAETELRRKPNFSAIARAWNDLSHPQFIRSRSGADWTPSTVRWVLTHARVAGCVELPTARNADGAVLASILVPNADGTLPPILTIPQLERIRGIALINRERSSGGSVAGRPVKYFMSGVATCSRCKQEKAEAVAENRMTATQRRRGWGKLRAQNMAQGRPMRLTCPYCKRLSIDMRFLEEFVGGATVELLSQGKHLELLRDAVNGDGAADLAEQINVAQRDLDEFRRIANKISSDSYVAWVTAKEEEIDRLTNALATAVQDNAAAEIPRLPGDLAETIAQHWDEADPEWKRMLIRLCWAEIEILTSEPGRWQDLTRRVVLVPRTTLSTT